MTAVYLTGIGFAVLVIWGGRKLVPILRTSLGYRGVRERHNASRRSRA